MLRAPILPVCAQLLFTCVRGSIFSLCLPLPPLQLLHASAPSFTDAVKTELSEEKTAIQNIVRSFTSYRKSIPRQNQRPLLAERICELLTELASHSGCRLQIAEALESIVEMVAKNSKAVPVHKAAAALFDSSADIAKKLKTTNFPAILGNLDKDTAKIYDKVKEKLK